MKFLALVLVGILSASSNKCVRAVVTFITIQIITMTLLRFWVLGVISLGGDKMRLNWGKTLDS